MPEPHKETHEADTLTAYGSEIKMLDDGKIGGYLVRFGTPDDTDLEGDFFTKDTDFGSASKSVTLWDHSMDPVLGDIELGEVEMKKTDIGVWVEGVLSLRESYEKYLDEEFGEGGSEKFLKAIKAFVKGGVAGWSSGVPAHRVRRQEIKDTSTGATKARHIIKWPLGLDASITPTPAEPRNKVVSLKSIDREHTINWKSLLANDEPEAEPEGSKGQDPAPAVKSDADSREAVDLTANQQTDTKETMADEQKNVEPDEKQEETKSNTGTPRFTQDDVDSILDAAQKRWQKENTTVKGVREIPQSNQDNTGAPAYVKRLGDSQKSAFRAWMEGDQGAMKAHVVDEGPRGEWVEIKASNATDMNIGTAADGGNTVTDDMFGRIIRRRDEMSLIGKLGIRRFTGTGTTIDVPVDNEADGEFVSTNEAAQFDEDAPAIGQVSLTKVKYTKRTRVSYELLEDTFADPVAFLEDHVSRGLAKTHNDKLITEVETNGSELKIFAATGAIAVDELEDIRFNNALSAYLDDSGSVGWVMQPVTHGNIVSLDDANMRRYAQNQMGAVGGAGDGGPLLGSPVYYSLKAEAEGSGNKPVLFGNWFFVGLYEDPSLRFLRDPYSRSENGQVQFNWYTRFDYAVLQSEAIGYGRNTTT